MGALTDYIVRGAAILFLLVVVSLGLRSIWLLAQPSSAILIRPFDVPSPATCPSNSRRSSSW